VATAKVIIAGQNNIGSAVKGAKSDLSSFGQAAQKVGDTLKKAFAVTAIVAAVKKLSDAASQCLSDFLQAQRAYKQLAVTLQDDAAYKSVTANIVKLSKQTLSSKDQVEAMVAELAALGKSADDINRISDASVYLSNVTGRDLTSSMTTLLNTYNGNVTQLRKLGVDTSDLTKKELEQGAAIDLVIQKFGELSQQMAKEDTSQHITNIKNNLGDMKQSIGDLVNFSIGPLLAKFDTVSENMRDNFDAFVQKVKVALENFPEVWNHLVTALKSGLSHLFSIEGMTQFFTNFFNHIMAKIRLVGDLSANLFDLVQGIATEALEGIGNYAMYWITHICDSLGINISEVINSMGTWLTQSPVGKVVDAVITTAVNGIRLIGALIKNIPQMVKLVVSNLESIVKNLWITLKNTFFETIKAIVDNLSQTLDRINFPQIIENIKVAITNVFGRVSAWFTAIGSTVKDTFRYIGDLLEATFSWNSVKTVFTTLFKNIGVIASTLIKEIFVNIPSMISSIFEGVLNWIGYVAVHLKNELHDALNSALDPFRTALGWIGIKVDSGKADRTGEENLKAKASASFANVGTGFSKAISDAIDSAAAIKENNKAISALYEGIEGINVASANYEEITAAIKDSGSFVTTLQNVSDVLGSKIQDNSAEWADISKQFAALLNPVFEKFVSDSSVSVGTAMAKWTAKSKDEYYEAAKKNFSNIGDFLQDWGSTFLSDMGDDWDGLVSSFSSIFSDAFGEDFDSFITWFKPFIEEKLAMKTTSYGTASSGGGSSSDEEENKMTLWDGVLNQFTSKMGEAGSLVSSLASNMSALGPVFGAILTAIEYVFDGLAETLGPVLYDFVKFGIEPLRELGRIVGSLLIPLIRNLMPFIQQVATFLVSIFNALGVVLQPVIEIINMVLTPVLQIFGSILEALMPVLKVFAKIVVTITGTIQYVIQVLQHWVATVMNWLAGLNIFGWHPFSGLRMSDPGSPGSYTQFIKSKWDAIDKAFDSSTDTVNSWSTDASTSTSTATSVTSAGYQGATQVTINIYQQAPVVGDGGMRTFAQMIRAEFEALSYYGVVS